MPEEYKTYGVALYTQRRAFARELLEKNRDLKVTPRRKEEPEEELMIV